MGYKLKGYYRVKEKGTFPWPCPAEPQRTLDLRPDDVLTKGDAGYTKHTGLMMTGILVPDEAVEWVDKTVGLTLM